MAAEQSPAIEVVARPGQPLGMPVAAFLATYWQKHPLLIRAAFPGLALPLEPEDLAGLACEELALSRLVRRDATADAWELRHGPFDDDDFAALPDDGWTLLVQDVDKWDADVAALLEHFRFLPSWRIDDIMVSYATPGGGVGPHIDQYDVFLLQGLGTRNWAINVDRPQSQAYRPDRELRLLSDFQPSHRWQVRPGDMLYLPPGVAHDGVAEDACMTFSIGTRAPAVSEMLLDCAEHQALRMPESLRYADQDLIAADTDPGRIDERTLDRVRQALGPMGTAMSHDALGLWFGAFITRYRSDQLPAPPERTMSAQALQQTLQRGAMLLRNPWTRLAWMPRGQSAVLFASGDSMPCPAELARELCRERYLALGEAPQGDGADALLQLVNEGHLQISDSPISADG